VEKLASDKHTSLLRTFVNYASNRFYNIGPGSKVTKLTDFFA
jgi:hypothetical protein